MDHQQVSTGLAITGTLILVGFGIKRPAAGGGLRLAESRGRGGRDDVAPDKMLTPAAPRTGTREAVGTRDIEGSRRPTRQKRQRLHGTHAPVKLRG